MEIYPFNAVAANAHINYNASLRGLAASVERLSTGEKLATELGGLAGVSDRMQQQIVGTEALTVSLTNNLGFVNTQLAVVQDVEEILIDMTALAAAALDPAKTDADRSALDLEFQMLISEVDNFAGYQYNNVSLFGNDIEIRYGLNNGDSYTLDSVVIQAMSFTGLSLNTSALASTALSQLTSRYVSRMASLVAQVAGETGRLERLIDYTQEYITNLTTSHSALRSVDVAQETANFTTKQVMVQAGQAILAQANRFSQGIVQFF